MKLETKRLILRPWKKTDLNDLIEGLNDYKVSKWMSRIPFPYTKQHAKKLLKRVTTEKKGKNRENYLFAIELKSEKKAIGGTSINKIDKVNGTCGGGIWINQKYSGKGYGLEAFDARIKFAFEKLKLRRIENGFFKGNKASEKMQKKLGYKIEGLQRKSLICLADNKYKDEYITGLLKEDWIKTKKKTKK